jgi:hypothetical protein
MELKRIVRATVDKEERLEVSALKDLYGVRGSLFIQVHST